MIIHKEFGEERNSVVEFSSQNRAIIRTQHQELESKNGYDLPEYHKFCNSYDCDDYLFVSWLVNKVVYSYDRMNYIPQISRWRENYKKAPYIHVELYDGNAIDYVDGIYVPNDKKLGLKVTGPKENGCYVLTMDRCYLLRYILFLSDIFDDNQELVFSFVNQKALSESVSKPQKLVSQNELLLMAKKMQDAKIFEPAQALTNYALSLSSDQKVPMPIATVINGKFSGFTFCEDQRNQFSLPLKKTIFNTSGFAKYFEHRNELIEELFVESFMAMFCHEFAHVANGHCLLSKSDSFYANQKEIRICAEQNADDTAIRLRLSDVLFDGENDDPHSYELIHSAKQLIHEWSIRSLAMHLGLSWMYRDDDRKWDDGTLQAYLDDRTMQHPLYQFRTFNVINRVLDWLSSIPDMPECEKFRTSDGHNIDHSLVSAAIKEVTSLIYSFESCFETTYGEEKRSVEEMLSQSWKVESRSLPTDPQKTPYLMPIFSPNAMSEVLAIKQKWPELKKRLEQSGTYSMLYESI